MTVLSNNYTKNITLNADEAEELRQEIDFVPSSTGIITTEQICGEVASRMPGFFSNIGWGILSAVGLCQSESEAIAEVIVNIHLALENLCIQQEGILVEPGNLSTKTVACNYDPSSFPIDPSCEGLEEFCEKLKPLAMIFPGDDGGLTGLIIGEIPSCTCVEITFPGIL